MPIFFIIIPPLAYGISIRIGPEIFAIIYFYSVLLILLGVSFIKIVRIVSVLGAIEILNVLAIHLDDHVGITMPHDPRNPKGISPQFNALVDKI
jgi:hypothetical protein